MLAMVEQVIASCPDEQFARRDIGVKEHVYHALVGMAVWLLRDPREYRFDQIVDGGAAELDGPAHDRVSKAFLLDYVRQIEKKVQSIPAEADDLLVVQTIMGKDLTFLDRCLGQLRHVQHHLGAANEILRAHGNPLTEWKGY